jgi:L-lysine exporter family protein LysE/ArgO
MPAMDFSATGWAALQGFALGAALIAAIGAQNAFVLRQGLRNEHLAWVVALCAGMDAALIHLGVFGASWMAQRLPGLAPALTWAGVLFLLGYGALSLWRCARGGQSLSAAQDGRQGLRWVLLQATAFTLLNPHVYLDTVLLVGSVGAQQPSAGLRWAFALGASTASLAWFTALGCASRLLAPWLTRPRVWQAVDGVMGVLLLLLAAGLAQRL